MTKIWVNKRRVAQDLNQTWTFTIMVPTYRIVYIEGT